jgi:hypothetical protein
MTKRTPLVGTAFVAAFTLVSFAPVPALAQSAPAPQPPQQGTPASPARAPVHEGDRNGRAIFGVSFGIGAFNTAGSHCTTCESSPGAGFDVDAVVGTFLGKRQALEFEFTALTPAEDTVTTVNAITLSYSRWLTSRVSVRAGYGVGYLKVPAAREDTFTATGPAGVLSAGVAAEIIHSRRWSMDGSFRFERIQRLEEPMNYLSMGVSMKFYPPLPKW